MLTDCMMKVQDQFSGMTILLKKRLELLYDLQKEEEKAKEEKKH